MPKRASPSESREGRIRPVGNRQIFPSVVAGVIRHSLGAPGDLQQRLLRYMWIEMMRFGAPNVRNVELSRIRGIQSVLVNGPVLRHDSLVLTALATVLECEKIFAFGTFVGDSWLLAHNIPTVHVYGLHLPGAEPDRAVQFRDTPEASRMTQLRGDAATFDFSPYSGAIDLVHVDGANGAGQLRWATDAAFGMLAELGSIVWDNYTYSADVYAYLNWLAPTLDRPIYHILGTRLALYSRWDIVLPVT